jgi:hypothetical protein
MNDPMQLRILNIDTTESSLKLFEPADIKCFISSIMGLGE